MFKLRLFGTLRPRLNVLPLLLTPGLVAIGYAVDGATGAWCAIAAWLALVIGAAVSCTLHTLRDVHESSNVGRQAFDYDAHTPL
jgi:hypothetical protein